MVDEGRQLPAASALARVIDLMGVDGPCLVVCQPGEHDTRRALTRHLLDLGSIPSTFAAERAFDDTATESVGVAR